MQKIYDKVFLFGVHIHILLDRVLVAIQNRSGKNNG